MSSRAETIRMETIRSKSPLRNHSMNQEKVRLGFEGEQRVVVPRKVRMAERRIQRIREAATVATLPFSADLFAESVHLIRRGEAKHFHAQYVAFNLGNFIPED